MAKVLYSPGFGAGWSTWNSSIPKEFMCMDPTLVAMAEAGAIEREVDAYITALYPDECFFGKGWRDIEVCEVADGTLFKISEYDGNESVHISSKTDYMVAA